MRCLVQPLMKRDHVRPFDGVDRAFSQRRYNVVVQRAAVRLCCAWLAMHRHVDFTEPLGQVGHRDRPRRIRLRPLAPLDPVDHRRGLLARHLRGDLPVPAQAHALPSARPARLNDEDLPARGVDPDAETGETAVPDYSVLVRGPQFIHRALGQADGTASGHGVSKGVKAVLRARKSRKHTGNTRHRIGGILKRKQDGIASDETPGRAIKC